MRRTFEVFFVAAARNRPCCAWKRCVAAACLALAAGLGTPSVHAAPNEDQSAVRKEAAERFDQGLRLFNEGNNSGALAEFQRAYELVPNPVVLYNVGLVYASMGQPVKAVEALEEVLQSKAGLSESERIRAEELLKEQARRVATLQLDNAPPGSVVSIDGVEVGRAPFKAPLRITVGTHVISVVEPGTYPFTHELTVAGGENKRVSAELVPLQRETAQIVIETPLPGADVVVDGKVVGTTPATSTFTVTPGKHRVELRRTGYRLAAVDAELTAGGSTKLNLSPEIDEAKLEAKTAGTVQLKLSEPNASVTVNGKKLTGSLGPLLLPAGQHMFLIEMSGFISQRKNIVLAAGSLMDLDVTLDPTQETRQAYVSRVHRQQLIGWITLGSGAAVAIGGSVFTVINNKKLNDAQTGYNDILYQTVDHSGRNCDVYNPSFDRAACDQAISSAYDNLQQKRTFRTVGWVTTGVGAAAVVTGAILLLTSDDASRYDRKATASSPLRIWMPSFGWTRSGAWLGLSGEL